MTAVTSPVCVNDFQALARQNLSKRAFEYFESGSDDEQTLTDNIQAFTRIRLRPRLMRDVSGRDMSTTILGQLIQFPLAISPIANHCVAHPDGEKATAKAASSVNTGMVLSSFSTTSIEDVATSAPMGIRWFQLYFFTDKKLVRNLVKRAEKAGYKALFITMDSPVFGKKHKDLRNNWSLPVPYSFRNLEGVIDGRSHSKVKHFFDVSATWDAVDWLRSITSLPIVAKGILTTEDAREAVRHGVSGILVSNHGGRQLDGVLASIDALVEVVEAVKGSGVEVYMDGGVRKGTDILKALALGARAVFVGRPVVWGLAYDGENGARKVLEMLRDEFDLAMALAGCRSVAEITPDLVKRRSMYSSKL